MWFTYFVPQANDYWPVLRQYHSLEHLKAILNVIWLKDQGETSPSLVASLSGNLCEEMERRIGVFYQMAREQEQRLAQLAGATPPAGPREE